jgi:hypothetical protein
MKYLLVVIMAVSLSLGVVIPAIADTGINVEMTTTVINSGGGGGGGGGIGGSNGSFPCTPPDWASIFPSMNQRGSSAQIDNRPVAQNPPIYIPPVVAQSQQSESVTLPSSPAQEDFKIDWFLIVCLGAILLSGTVVVIILVRR